MCASLNKSLSYVHTDVVCSVVYFAEWQLRFRKWSEDGAKYVVACYFFNYNVVYLM